MSIQVCRDTSDAVALYLPQRLYLKSFAKLNISVQIPSHKVHGKSISNWELMEKLRKMIQPDSFSLLKVSKHSSEVIRFDAELENRQKLERVLGLLEDRIINLNDYPDPLRVKASEAKSDFPSRHSWDSFFRDATDMDEMKPGERPDTIHITYLPIRWFVHVRETDDDALPSETIFKKVFERYGSVRQIDVPAADPFRMQMKPSMRGMTIPIQEGSSYFEGYVQFSEYAAFVRCMDSLRGRKLLHKSGELAEWCCIKVDFDRTKHMTDAAVKRRAIVREKLAARQRAKDEEEKLEREKNAKREAKERQKATVSRIIFQYLRQKIDHQEKEKLVKMREREERRKKKQLAKLMEREDVDLNKKVAEEQRKLLKCQKKLQALRLIDELFKRIELRPELKRNGSNPERYYKTEDRLARLRLVEKLKQQQEKELEEQRERLRHALDGRIVIRSALETKKPIRESSIDSLSDDNKDYKRIKPEKLSPTRELNFNKNPGMYYQNPNPYCFGYPFVPPPGYPYPQSAMYYAARGAYFPAEGGARRARGRGRGRGRGRLPYFDGPNATHQYYQYFKKLNEREGHARSRTHSHSRSRSRSHSRRRSYSRSRSHSRRHSYSRSKSRSRSRGRRSRSRRSRSRRSRSRSRSRSRRSRSHSRSISRSRRRSKSRSRRSKTKSRSKSSHRTPPKPATSHDQRIDDNKIVSPVNVRQRTRSWSLPRDGEKRESWSKD